ncbi:hypothetical protein [Sporosarcina sp. FSL K6-3457]|uniref:hypothetical protein n=1 Tax=Sporosarcina sp. FSL K6-3457 TaxID=2978204 RepID=UPI0030F89016
MGEYFPITVSGIDKEEVERRVAEHLLNGFEIVAEGSDSWSVPMYKRTDGIGRSKYSFDQREEREKFTVMMRGKNTKQVQV